MEESASSPDLPSSALSLDCDDRWDMELETGEVLLSILSEEDFPSATFSSVTVFLASLDVSSLSMLMTLTGGTSVWKIPEPSELRLIPKGLVMRVPSTYQPDRECSVWTRFSPTFCEEEIPQRLHRLQNLRNRLAVFCSRVSPTGCCQPLTGRADFNLLSLADLYQFRLTFGKSNKRHEAFHAVYLVLLAAEKLHLFF